MLNWPCSSRCKGWGTSFSPWCITRDVFSTYGTQNRLLSLLWVLLKHQKLILSLFNIAYGPFRSTRGLLVAFDLSVVDLRTSDSPNGPSETSVNTKKAKPELSFLLKASPYSRQLPFSMWYASKNKKGQKLLYWL